MPYTDEMTTNKKENHVPDKIDTIYAFIAFNETGEGIVAMPAADGWMPMIAADAARLESLRPIAKQIAQSTKIAIKLIRLTTREELETYT